MGFGFDGEKTGSTLYEIALESMREYIQVYLDLARRTNAFTAIQPDNIQEYHQRVIVLGGINSPLDPSTISSEEVVQEWQSMRAVPFQVELAITRGVYIPLRNRTDQLIEQLDHDTSGFLEFDPHYIHQNPYMLPILQRLANFSSKSEMKSRIGNVSDHAISMPVAERLVSVLTQREPGRTINRPQLFQSIQPTLEGIVRDLVGKVLLEDIVANALDGAGVPYMRESQYRYLPGVVYDFRADFVIPDANDPKAFIEVRKSSSRHASLYAKDKMFSAINWKGNNRDLLAVLIVDGPWTGETLYVMSKVYDYVTPLSMVSDAVDAISNYLKGAQNNMKWHINFSIQPASVRGG